MNLSRTPTVAQKIAKLFADPCRAVEGCDRAARIEFDHRIDWADIKVTELHHLEIHCDHHHDLTTFEGWKLVEGTGRRPMVPPDDPRHPDYGKRAESRSERRGTPAAEHADAARPAEPAAPAPAASWAQDPKVIDAMGRLQRLRQREAERQARASGQDTLFDTG